MQYLLMICLVAGLVLWGLSLMLKISCIPSRILFISSLLHPCLVAPYSLTEKNLYVLQPVHLGSLGLINPCSAAHSCFHDSEQLTSPLVALIVTQYMQSIRKNNEHHTLVADTLHSQLSSLLNIVLTMPGNLDHLHSLLFCQYSNTTFICTRMILGCCLCVMASHHLTHQVLSSVEPLFQLIILFYKLFRAFLQSHTTRSKM